MSLGREPRAYSVGYASLPALRAAVREEGAIVVRRIPALRVAEVRSTSSAFGSRLAGRPGISSVQRVALRRQAAEPALALASGTTVPWEWQYAATHADVVPDRVLRAASRVTIAVVDTGADVSAPGSRGQATGGFSTRTRTSDVRDTVGHGTFVAALAAGSVTNGDGIAGFGGDAKLMILKAGAGDGSFTDVDEASAIAYAVDHGARIVNLSLGGTSDVLAWRRARSTTRPRTACSSSQPPATTSPAAIRRCIRPRSSSRSGRTESAARASRSARSDAVG